ncbi:CxxC-x17-CxxC domain-containing protein [Patescibacteria group bacterium]
MDNNRQMYQATCANCGNSCEVPFRPTGDKPVLCRNCFSRKGNRSQGRSSDRRMFQGVCANCGNKCEVPFQPREGKPIFCNDCFGKKSGGRDNRRQDSRHQDRRSGGGSDQVSQQLKSLNGKLDRILSLLDSGSKSAQVKPADKKTPVLKTKKKTVKKTAKKKK